MNIRYKRKIGLHNACQNSINRLGFKVPMREMYGKAVVPFLA